MDREVLPADRHARVDVATLAGQDLGWRACEGPWPQPARESVRDRVLFHATAHPAWGHRKIWAMVRHDGYVVSEATVLRLLRDEGLILPAYYQRERCKLAVKRPEFVGGS